MTNWSDDESIHLLVRTVEDQIPMNVTQPCKDAVHEWVFDLMKGQKYAGEMVDAAGKIPAGIRKFW